jgi:hypothetical protein
VGLVATELAQLRGASLAHIGGDLTGHRRGGGAGPRRIGKDVQWLRARRTRLTLCLVLVAPP